MENNEDNFMSYIEKEEHGMLRRDQQYLDILAENITSTPTLKPTSSSNNDNNDDINSFTFTDKAFTAWFIVVPPVAAGILGAATGLMTHIPAGYLTDNSKMWLSATFRFLTLCDAALTSGFSLTYSSDKQITVLQHTITPIWILSIVPTTFVAMKKLTWHIGNHVPLAQQGD